MTSLAHVLAGGKNVAGVTHATDKIPMCFLFAIYSYRYCSFVFPREGGQMGRPGREDRRCPNIIDARGGVRSTLITVDYRPQCVLCTVCRLSYEECQLEYVELRSEFWAHNILWRVLTHLNDCSPFVTRFPESVRCPHCRCQCMWSYTYRVNFVLIVKTILIMV